jgi:thiamine monophosphate synthase
MKCNALRIDAALVSPVFSTKSHLMPHPLGISKFQTMAKASSIPVYALGGINNNNATRLINSPAIGIAGISAISQI